MDSGRYKKQYEVARDGMIRVYPSLNGGKEKGRLIRILKQLMHLRKAR